MRYQAARGVCHKIGIKQHFVFITLTSLMFILLNTIKMQASADLALLSSDTVISMDFQDVSLKDLLKVFSIQTGLNFIASEAVQDRTITLYLDKVPVKEAMDQLFKANNLTYEYDEISNIIIVKDWGKPQIEIVTKVFALKYASVSASSIKSELKKYMAAAGAGGTCATGGGGGGGELTAGAGAEVTGEVGITEAIKKLLSENGRLVEDPRTNSLIITDIPSRFPIIEETIKRLDIPTPMVMLEVEMLDVSKNTVDRLGVDWPTSILSLDVTGQRATNFPFSGSSKADNRQWIVTDEITSPSGNWKFSNFEPNHFLPSILTVIGANLTLDFLRSQSDTKYLARPRLLTLNNETAEIKIATNEAIGIKTVANTTSGGAATTSVEPERTETGVILRVTPQINIETGEVTLFIYPKVADATQGSQFISANNTYQYRDPEERSTKSIVKIKDGETVVLGGLIRKEFIENKEKIPILGDIPLLGALFRHKGSSTDKDKERELLVFITPHIIKEEQRELAKIGLPQGKVALEREQQLPEYSLKRQKSITATLGNFEK